MHNRLPIEKPVQTHTKTKVVLKKEYPSVLNYKTHFFASHNVSETKLDNISNYEMPLINKLKNARKRIAELKTQIKNLEEKRRTAGQGITDIDIDISQSEREIEQYEKQIKTIWTQSKNTGTLELIYKLLYDPKIDPEHRLLRIMRSYNTKYPIMTKQELLLSSIIRYALIVFSEHKNNPDQYKLFMNFLKELSTN